MKSYWKCLVGMVLGAVLANPLLAADKDIVDTAVGAGSFKTLAAALTAADLVGALKGPGPFTVFAPTDAAFAKLPAGTVESLVKPENKSLLTSILTYHVVSGSVMAGDVVKLTQVTTLNGQRVDIKVSDGSVSIDGAQVVTTDIACSNGVIHVIDAVLMPVSDNIPAVATKAGKFSTLLAAAKAAGLVGALSGEDALTVFAPTDEAFAKLPAGTVAALLKPENKAKLVEILTYHVVKGRVYSDQALAAKQATTLQGGTIDIAVVGKVTKVNTAALIAMDIEDIVTRLGHRPIGVARTRSEAVKLAMKEKPGIILADIQLADGSSGIDAVNDLLAEFEAPVIFITAFPERLLTGSRPEPTFLITKPFSPEMVKAMISQALFFDSKSTRADHVRA